MPRIRGRLYSSWASSTWSLPSALAACWAKMSRISCVRSTTRAVRRVLERALLRRLELVVDEQHLRAWRRRRPASAPRACPCPTYVRGSGARAAGRARRSARHPPCARARAARRAPPRRRRISGARPSSEVPPSRARVGSLARRHRGDCATLVARCPPSPTGLRGAHARARRHPVESRHEAEIALRTSVRSCRRRFDARVRRPRTRSSGRGRRRAVRPLVVLAGHYDTVPAQENVPGRIENGAVARAAERAT